MNKQKLLTIGGIILLVAIAGLFVQSTLPAGGSGGYPTAYQGATETWTSALDSQIGSDLFALMGCSNQQQLLEIYYTSEFKCKTTTSNGQYVFITVTDPTTYVPVYCNYFAGSSSAIPMAGTSSALIPINALPGAGNCQVRATYHVRYSTQTITDQIWQGIQVNQQVQSCVEGSTTCINSGYATCSGGVYTNTIACPPGSPGCSNGQCLAGCSVIGAIECNGNSMYKTCGQDYQWSGFTYLPQTQQCINDQLVAVTIQPTGCSNTCTSGYNQNSYPNCGCVAPAPTSCSNTCTSGSNQNPFPDCECVIAVITNQTNTTNCTEQGGYLENGVCHYCPIYAPPPTMNCTAGPVDVHGCGTWNCPEQTCTAQNLTCASDNQCCGFTNVPPLNKCIANKCTSVDNTNLYILVGGVILVVGFVYMTSKKKGRKK